MLNNRCRKILIKILKASEGIKTHYLAEAFNISVRTVRNDLNEIDYFLRANNFSSLSRKANYGVSYPADRAEREKVFELLENQRISLINLTPDERILEILYQFCLADDYLKLDQQANRLMVSKSTVAKDVERLKALICNEQVGITANLHGSKLIGEEAKLRMTVVNLFISAMDKESSVEVLNMLNEQEPLKVNRVYLLLFEDIDMSVLNSSLEIVSKSIKRPLPDLNYINLAGNLAMQIKRIKKGKEIRTSTAPRDYDHLLSSIADQIAMLYRDYFNLEISAQEKDYICQALEFAVNVTLKVNDKINWAEIQILACYIAENVSREAEIDFYNDNILLNGLSDELLTIILKSGMGLPLKNSLLSQIKDYNIEFYGIIKKSLSQLVRILDRDVSDDEVGSIAVHFFDSLERKNQQANPRSNILIVCSEGGTMLKMLSNRITTLFDVNIIGACGYRNIHQMLARHQIDYVVSTITINELDVQTIKVSPLLTVQDINILKGYLPSKVIDTSLVEKIYNIIEKSCEIIDKKRLIRDIHSILGFTSFIGYHSQEMPDLKTVLDPDNIIIDYDAADWEEAVRSAGEVLLKNGYIAAGYVENMLKDLKEIGSPALISPGIVLAHARNYELSHQVGLSMVRLQEPVQFIEGKDIDIVFAMSSINNKSHLVALSQFAQILNDDRKVEVLRKGSSVIEIVSMLNEINYSKNYI